MSDLMLYHGVEGPRQYDPDGLEIMNDEEYEVHQKANPHLPLMPRVLPPKLYWQPIDTAPNNTWILVYDKPNRMMAVAEYRDMSWYPEGISGYEWEFDLVPTHWMPLPKAPQ